MERIRTGIEEFDEMLQGGFIPNSSNLLSGEPGTGKTIFSLQFIYEGAKKYNQKGLFLSFEQTEEEIIAQAESFGWEFRKLIDEKKIAVYSIPIQILDEEIIGTITKLIEKFTPERVVIDSISTFAISAPMYVSLSRVNVTNSIKYFMYKFVMDLKKTNCTSIITCELRQPEWISRESIAEFVVDSVTVLRYFGAMGETSRTITIKKARQTKFDEFVYPFEFKENGIKINKNQGFNFSKEE